MTSAPMSVLFLHDATDAHREAVQQIVKAHASCWWHHFPDLWIAGGHSHLYWADLIEPVLALSRAGLIVLELPRDSSQRMFATRGANPAGMAEWLWEIYYGRPPRIG